MQELNNTTKDTENTERESVDSNVGKSVGKTGKSTDKHTANWWKKGQSGNPKGRLPDTPAQKLTKKANKQFIKEYKAKLTQALPHISPVLIAKAIKGDMTAIKEVNDRALGKAEQRKEIVAQIIMPTPIIPLDVNKQNVIQGNNSDKKDSSNA